jgi:hypothetical protein
MSQELSGIVGEHARAVNAFDSEAIVATVAERTARRSGTVQCRCNCRIRNIP